MVVHHSAVRSGSVVPCSLCQAMAGESGLGRAPPVGHAHDVTCVTDVTQPALTSENVSDTGVLTLSPLHLSASALHCRTAHYRGQGDADAAQRPAALRAAPGAVLGRPGSSAGHALIEHLRASAPNLRPYTGEGSAGLLSVGRVLDAGLAATPVPSSCRPRSLTTSPDSLSPMPPTQRA